MRHPDFKEPKYRKPDPAKGETKGMGEYKGEYYLMGGMEPVRVRNEKYEHIPRMGEM